MNALNIAEFGIDLKFIQIRRFGPHRPVPRVIVGKLENNQEKGDILKNTAGL